MRVRGVTKSSPGGKKPVVTPDVEKVLVYGDRDRDGYVLKLEEDPFLDKMILTIHREEFRQRVNSAGEIEITIGGA